MHITNKADFMNSLTQFIKLIYKISILKMIKRYIFFEKYIVSIEFQ